MNQSPRYCIALLFALLVSVPAYKLYHARHDLVSPLQPVTHAPGETQAENRHPDITRHIRERAYRLWCRPEFPCATLSPVHDTHAVVSMVETRPMLHAYRLLYRDSLDAPDSLWEWHQPWIDYLLWHARTFRRQVVHCYFATWQGLEQANTRLWATTYAPCARYALWPTWHARLVDYRELLVITREVYEGRHGQRGTPCPP